MLQAVPSNNVFNSKDSWGLTTNDQPNDPAIGVKDENAVVEALSSLVVAASYRNSGGNSPGVPLATAARRANSILPATQKCCKRGLPRIGMWGSEWKRNCGCERRPAGKSASRKQRKSLRLAGGFFDSTTPIASHWPPESRASLSLSRRIRNRSGWKELMSLWPGADSRWNRLSRSKLFCGEIHVSTIPEHRWHTVVGNSLA